MFKLVKSNHYCWFKAYTEYLCWQYLELCKLVASFKLDYFKNRFWRIIHYDSPKSKKSVDGGVISDKRSCLKQSLLKLSATFTVIRCHVDDFKKLTSIIIFGSKVITFIEFVKFFCPFMFKLLTTVYCYVVDF